MHVPTEPSVSRDRVFRFGSFELSEREGELRKSGVRIKLQEQPFRVLMELVANAGRLVSREDLHQKLWPSDTFVDFPRYLWKKLRTTNSTERRFVEVRRRTRPMVCFVNVKSVDRIIYSIFQRFNLEWKTRTLRVFTQAA